MYYFFASQEYLCVCVCVCIRICYFYSDRRTICWYGYVRIVTRNNAERLHQIYDKSIRWIFELSQGAI